MMAAIRRMWSRLFEKPRERHVVRLDQLRLAALVTSHARVGAKNTAIRLEFGVHGPSPVVFGFVIDSETAARFPVGSKLVGIFTKED